jgi:hypothetical protein
MSLDWSKQKKTVVFLILDIIFMFLFSWFWFKYVHPEEGPVDPAKESSRFTFWMTAFFAVYYYSFELSWKYMKPWFGVVSKQKVEEESSSDSS